MSENTDIKLALKKLSYTVRITTFAKGKTKNDFIDDCVHRSIGESQNAKQIIKLYFDILSKYPHLRGKEYSDILLFLTKSQP